MTFLEKAKLFVTYQLLVVGWWLGRAINGNSDLRLDAGKGDKTSSPEQS